jgi:hypothetical protein
MLSASTRERKHMHLYRDEEGQLYATDGLCTHGNTYLSEGLVWRAVKAGDILRRLLPGSGEGAPQLCLPCRAFVAAT